MGRHLLILLTGIGLCYSNSLLASRSGNNSMGYPVNGGSYYEYKISGYNIQPNRPGIWDAGCRRDNYYCTAQLERCRGQQDIVFTQPNIVKGHR